MAITFNESSVAAEPFGVHAKRRRLLTTARVAGTQILLDRLTLEAGAVIELEVAAGSLAWFQMLDGAATLSREPQQFGQSTSVEFVGIVKRFDFDVIVA